MNLPPSRDIGNESASAAQTIAASAAKWRRGKWFVFGAGLLFVLSTIWYFTADDTLHGSGSSTAQRLIPAAPVRVAEVVRRDMHVVRRTPGTVLANTTVQITARVQGIIESATFKEGQFVKRGDILFQIDSKPFEAALAQAKAVLARDQAQLKNAERDMNLYENLNKLGAVSTQQRDASISNVEALNATIGADQAAVNIAQLNLGYTQIRSPVNGKTGPVLVQPGNMVLATGTTPLVIVEEIQPVKVSFSLPQSDLHLILAREKQKRLIALVDDGNGEPLSAPVDFVSNAVNNQSGTIELRANFDNRDFSFLPGQLVNVTVELDTIPDALVVPRNAVNEGPSGAFVYVVADGKARLQNVSVLFDDSIDVAIEGNLKPGDPVIVEGQLRVDPNGAVRIVGPDPPTTNVSRRNPQSPGNGESAR